MAERLDEHAAQEERERLARDLHDSITQALFAAALKAEVLADDRALPEDAASTAEEVRRLTRGALAQIARCSELRTEGYREVPIAHLLRNAVEATESRTRVDVDLRLSGDGVPAGDLHSAIYRVTQEALNNVARHARARHVVVELQAETDQLRLSIHDDGCWFETGGAAAGPPGLEVDAGAGRRGGRRPACGLGARRGDARQSSTGRTRRWPGSRRHRSDGGRSSHPSRSASPRMAERSYPTVSSCSKVRSASRSGRQRTNWVVCRKRSPSMWS